MPLTAKDFRELAKIVRDWKGNHACDANHLSLAQDFAEFASKHNAAFDRERFLAACDVAPCVRCHCTAPLYNNMGVEWCSHCNEPAYR